MRITIGPLLRPRREPAALFVNLIKCAMYYHHHTLVRQMLAAES
jgi:hypothetical protein